MEFRITRLIGFKTPYVDTGVPLEDGYYLIRSYFKTEANQSSMGDGFNSVFSYLRAENGRYRLIKPFTPYAGLVKFTLGGLEEPYSANLFYRMMSYMPYQYCFEVDTSGFDGEVESDYYPATYKAKKYVDYSVEFHTEDYRIYSVIDLGTDFKREFALMYSVSGFMEVAGGMGSGIQILYMDYDHIIKLSDENVDYRELEGDRYSFETQGSFYPGDYADLNEKNLTYEETLAHGLSTRMVNFWYSVASDNTPYPERRVYNSKITFRPTAQTNAGDVADARYGIAHFDIRTDIYGYDVQTGRGGGEELYYDSMSVQTFGYNGLRESVNFRLGKTVETGAVIRLEELYREMVSGENDFSAVTYQGYALEGGQVDFSREVSLREAFSFSAPCAILFTTTEDDGSKCMALVELAERSAPEYRISDENHNWQWSDEKQAYVSDTVDKEGSLVELPAVTYSWTGVRNVRFKSHWYDDETCIHPLHVGIFANADGVYSLSYIGHQAYGFTISKEETYVCYEMVNIYGETEWIRFRYNTTQKETYRLESNGGEVLAEGDVRYDDYGKRRNVKADESVYLTGDNFEEMLSRRFFLILDGEAPYSLNPVGYTLTLTGRGNRTEVITRDLDGSLTDPATLIEEIRGYMTRDSWFTLSVVYRSFGDEFESRYLWNVGFSGEKTTDMLKHRSYFCNTLYTMSIPRLFSEAGDEIAKSYIVVQHRIGGKTDNSFYARRTYTLTEGEYEYSLKFHEAGEYYVGFRFSLNGLSFSFGQVVGVLSDQCDVKITFVTDPDHPFTDGLTERTVTYNLGHNINTLQEEDFVSRDILFGWTESETRDATSRDIVRNGISDFIGRYHAQHVILYAVWDGGISVTAKAEGNEDRVKHYFRDASSGYYGIDLSAFKVYAPAGYVLAGWTGGFLGDTVRTGQVSIRTVGESEDFFTVTAVYRKMLTVRYHINTAYSRSVIKNDAVMEGYGLESNRVALATEGYSFAGWFVQGDTGRTIIDLSSYRFTEDTVLVALFTDSEGNEVW